jgi:hypothetical protein
MAAAAAASAVRKPFDGPGSPLMASQGPGKMGGLPPGMGGLGPMSAHPALRHFFAAASPHHQHLSEAQAGFLAQGLHPALAASLAAAGHTAHSLMSPQTSLPPHNGNNNDTGAPSFQSVLASLSAYRPRPSVSSPSTSPTSTPSSQRPNLSSSPDFSALLRMQQPNLPSLAAAVARSMPSFVPASQGGVSPPPSQPPSPSAVAAAMAAVAAGRQSAANPAAAESLNALRLKAREHELRLEMIKKMES